MQTRRELSNRQGLIRAWLDPSISGDMVRVGQSVGSTVLIGEEKSSWPDEVGIGMCLAGVELSSRAGLSETTRPDEPMSDGDR